MGVFGNPGRYYYCACRTVVMRCYHGGAQSEDQEARRNTFADYEAANALKSLLHDGCIS
jgi:hypothetical protein